MRLLHTTKLHLVEFQAHQGILPPVIPPYAILSHTWAVEEVSFQDAQQGLARSRRGYEKVAGACALAVQDGFDYLVCRYPTCSVYSDSNSLTSGSTLAASTSRARPSSRKPSTPCSDGTETPKCVTHS